MRATVIHGPGDIRVEEVPDPEIRLPGDAVVKVSYTAPQDGSARTSELKFDGHDDSFYKLRAGDTLNILVANKNPDKIRLD